MLPMSRGGEPGWGARKFPKADRSGQFVPLASGTEGMGYGRSFAGNGTDGIILLGIAVLFGMGMGYWFTKNTPPPQRKI